MAKMQGKEGRGLDEMDLGRKYRTLKEKSMRTSS